MTEQRDPSCDFAHVWGEAYKMGWAVGASNNEAIFAARCAIDEFTSFIKNFLPAHTCGLDESASATILKMVRPEEQAPAAEQAGQEHAPAWRDRTATIPGREAPPIILRTIYRSGQDLPPPNRPEAGLDWLFREGWRDTSENASWFMQRQELLTGEAVTPWDGPHRWFAEKAEPDRDETPKINAQHQMMFWPGELRPTISKDALVSDLLAAGWAHHTCGAQWFIMRREDKDGSPLRDWSDPIRWSSVQGVEKTVE